MKPAMSARANLIVLLALGLLLAALISRSGQVALLALPFVIFLGAGLVTAPREAHLTARREMRRQRALAGQTVVSRVAIVNQGASLPLVKLRDELPQGLLPQCGSERERAALLEGESLALEYSFSAGRGRYTWQSVQAAVSDPFALFETRLELAAPATLHVLASRPPIKGLRLRPRQTRPTSGPHLSWRAGLGTDFYGVREYRPGDSLRRIAWRLAARHPGEFHSREYEQEEMADIGLLLDARTAFDLKQDGERLLDYSIQAGSLLAEGFLNAGDRVSLLVLGRQITRVFPGTGKRQNLAIQEALAACQPGDKVSFETLKYLPVKLFPGRSTLVVVSPLQREDLAPLMRLRAAGYQVIAVSPDPVAFIASGDATHSPGARAAAVERRLLLRQIRRSGIRVIDWKVDRPVIKILRSTAWVQP